MALEDHFDLYHSIMIVEIFIFFSAGMLAASPSGLFCASCRIRSCHIRTDIVIDLLIISHSNALYILQAVFALYKSIR